MSYYNQKQYLAIVDRNDKIIGKAEKWEAHKKGLLHRGFTCIIYYQDKIILQQRKHPVFDDVLDLSFSSHPIYIGNNLQQDVVAVGENLKREWNIVDRDLEKKPRFINKVYYKAIDKKTGYIEHEIDYIFSVNLKKIPEPNLDFAYGSKIVEKKILDNFLKKNSSKLAPWVDKINL